MTTSRALSTVLAVLALAALSWAYFDYRTEVQRRAERLQTLDNELGTRELRLKRVLGSDPDVIEADNRLALALVAHVLDPQTRSDVASEEEARKLLERQIEGLDEAERIAKRSLSSRPSSWRALTVLGATTYLRWSFNRDERLIREYRTWEAPLLAARKIAAGRNDPTRFLTMAYLEMWPILSEEKRGLTKSMLKQGLSDRGAYLATIDPWLRAASSSSESLELLPDSAWVHDDLRKRLVTHGNPSLAAEADRRYRERILDEAQQLIEQSQSESARKDFITARKTSFRAIQALPVEQQSLPLFEQAIRTFPAGPIPEINGGWRQWLDFNASQCLRRPCPLARDVVERMLPSTRDLRRMRTLLSLGNVGAAEALEPEIDERCGIGVPDYWLHKTRVLLTLGDLAGARRSLVACPSDRFGPHTRYLKERLADAIRPGTSNVAAAKAFSETNRRFVGEFHGNSVEFGLPKGAYEIHLQPAPRLSGPVLVEVSVDGALVAVLGAALEAGEKRNSPLVVSVNATGTPQLLNARTLRGPRVIWSVARVVQASQ